VRSRGRGGEERRGEERSIDVQMQRRKPYWSWRSLTGDGGGDEKVTVEESRREARREPSGWKK
jgi:hypothetical protein